jgi:hypothetical protein
MMDGPWLELGAGIWGLKMGWGCDLVWVVRYMFFYREVLLKSKRNLV